MAKTLGSVRSRETSVMQLARSAEVTPTVVRFYMRSGLLPGPHPQPDGRLGYDESDTMRLRLLVTLHRLGIDGAEEVAALAGTTIPADLAGRLRARIDRKRSRIACQRTALDELDASLGSVGALIDAATSHASEPSLEDRS